MSLCGLIGLKDGSIIIVDLYGFKLRNIVEGDCIIERLLNLPFFFFFFFTNDVLYYLRPFSYVLWSSIDIDIEGN